MAKQYIITLNRTETYMKTVDEETMTEILAQVGQTLTPGVVPDSLDVESALHQYADADDYTADWLLESGAWSRSTYEYAVKIIEED